MWPQLASGAFAWRQPGVKPLFLDFGADDAIDI